MSLKQPEARATFLDESDTEKHLANAELAAVQSSPTGESARDGTTPVPLSWKLMSVVLVTAIGFGSQWSSGITGAMKSTIKKELQIDNKQFALLEASEDFMVTALMLCSGIVTDRIGGAGKQASESQPASYG